MNRLPWKTKNRGNLNSWVEPEIPPGWDYARILPRFRRKEPTPLGLWERINRRIYQDLREEMGKETREKRNA